MSDQEKYMLAFWQKRIKKASIYFARLIGVPETE